MVSNTTNLESRNYSDIPKLSRGYSDISTLSRIFFDIPALSRSYSHILTLSRSYSYISALSRSYSDIPTLSRSYSDIPTLSLLVRRGDVYYLLLTLYSQPLKERKDDPNEGWGSKGTINYIRRRWGRRGEWRRGRMSYCG